MNLVTKHFGRLALAQSNREQPRPNEEPGLFTKCSDAHVGLIFSSSGKVMFRVVWNEEQEMRDAISKVHRFLVSEDGPTAVEYAVMLGLIVVAIIGVVTNLAKSVSGTFSTVSSTLGSS